MQSPNLFATVFLLVYTNGLNLHQVQTGVCVRIHLYIYIYTYIYRNTYTYAQQVVVYTCANNKSGHQPLR